MVLLYFDYRYPQGVQLGCKEGFQMTIGVDRDSWTYSKSHVLTSKNLTS